jgi:hypothetical protein
MEYTPTELKILSELPPEVVSELRRHPSVAENYFEGLKLPPIAPQSSFTDLDFYANAKPEPTLRIKNKVANIGVRQSEPKRIIEIFGTDGIVQLTVLGHPLLNRDPGGLMPTIEAIAV